MAARKAVLLQRVWQESLSFPDSKVYWLLEVDLSLATTRTISYLDISIASSKSGLVAIGTIQKASIAGLVRMKSAPANRPAIAATGAASRRNSSTVQPW
ncbi:MAG TPA: hypothetical protein VGD52_24255 [Pseudoduganella sp.]